MKRFGLISGLLLFVLPLVAAWTDGGFRFSPPFSLLVAASAPVRSIPAEAHPEPEKAAPAPAPSPEPEQPPAETTPPAGGAQPGGQTDAATPSAERPAAQTPAPPRELGTDWVLAPRLKAAVEKATADFSGQYSVAVQDLTTGKRWVLGADDRYHPASTIKMPVTLYALNQYRSGKLRWTDVIEYTRADFESPGGGAFETAPFGGLYPVENLVNRALMYSNNVAVNMLGRHLGWNNIRDWTRSIGGELYRQEDGTPQVTVLSELGWWLHLDKLMREETKAADLIVGPLRNVAYSGRIPAGLPQGTDHLHKFGSYNGNFHDGGIVLTDRPYALVVMTSGGREYEVDAAIPRVSAAIYQVMASR